MCIIGFIFVVDIVTGYHIHLREQMWYKTQITISPHQTNNTVYLNSY